MIEKYTMKSTVKIKAVLLIITVCLFFSCNTNSIGSIKIEELIQNIDNPNYVVIDIRSDSLYNGFKEENAKRGGHIKGAIQFSKEWLDYIQDDKFETFAADKGITKDKTLIVYGSDKSSTLDVSIEFASRGYTVKTFNNFIEYAECTEYPMSKLPNYHLSISPEWLYSLMQNKKPETYSNDNFMIFEVSWGTIEKSTGYSQHIKGAFHFNTDWVENAPLWNLSEPSTIKDNLLKSGITKNKTIILYSSNQMAAYRVFWALKWAGVEDVRVMNGTLSTWIAKGFPVEKNINLPQEEIDFGTSIPLNTSINISMPEEILEKQQAGLKLISNRAWEEYIGNISGYDYIPGKGEPKGAIWGFAGTDSSNMTDYYDPDGTLRNPKEIFILWKEQNIHQNDELAFYCGTGWRAGVPWFITQLAGWEHTAIYDGGWNAWQMDARFPIQIGAPNNMEKPDAKNTFGTPGEKKASSCRS